MLESLGGIGRQMKAQSIFVAWRVVKIDPRTNVARPNQINRYARFSSFLHAEKQNSNTSTHFEKHASNFIVDDWVHRS
jgi:hypothetical protein